MIPLAFSIVEVGESCFFPVILPVKLVISADKIIFFTEPTETEFKREGLLIAFIPTWIVV
jgi:hypothetical protein